MRSDQEFAILLICGTGRCFRSRVTLLQDHFLNLRLLLRLPEGLPRHEVLQHRRQVDARGALTRIGTRTRCRSPGKSRQYSKYHSAPEINPVGNSTGNMHISRHLRAGPEPECFGPRRQGYAERPRLH